MIRLTRKLTAEAPAEASLTLTLDQRLKRRLRVRLDDGREAGIFLEGRDGLRDGDRLASDEGVRVAVKAAPERLSTIRCDDPLLLARACYHLGNRHVALQIEPGRLRYLHDHVLDDLVLGLGLEVRVEEAPFEPEPGAYGATHPPDHGGAHRH